MVFILFSVTVATAFFVGSLVLLNVGRRLGLRYLRQDGGTMAGLATVEGAVFALIGLLLAFTISGALQRFDDRRQLVIQEANAITTASDRVALFEGNVARNLQFKLKEYVRARIDLYRMPHDFSLWQREEAFSAEQQDKIVERKSDLWSTAVSACPQANFKSACSLALPALSNLFEVARLRVGASEKHPPQIVYAMLFGLGLGGSPPGRLRYGRCKSAQLDSYGDFRRNADRDALCGHRHGISATWASGEIDGRHRARNFFIPAFGTFPTSLASYVPDPSVPGSRLGIGRTIPAVLPGQSLSQANSTLSDSDPHMALAYRG
jgi:hypothetical protein